MSSIYKYFMAFEFNAESSQKKNKRFLFRILPGASLSRFCDLELYF